MSELNVQNINTYVLTKLYVKFVAKILKHRILFKDKLTFLGLEYRDASLITLYLIVSSDQSDDYIP